MGVSWTFLRGLAGIELCVGGGASELVFEAGERFGRGPPRFGSGEGRGGGAMREDVCAGMAFRRGGWGPRMPPDARCAEFKAGKEGGGMASVSEEERVKDGTELEFEVGFARGVVGEEGDLMVGGGGGGITIRSASSFLGVAGASIVSFSVGLPFSVSLSASWFLVTVGSGSCIDGGALPVFSILWGCRSHVKKDHVVGGCL